MLRLNLLLPLLLVAGFCQDVQSSVDMTRGQRVKKAVVWADSVKWDINVPIPFIIDSQFNETQKTKIREVAKMFNDNTCLNFEEDSGPGLKLEYAFDGADGAYCRSDIGDTRNKATNSNHKVHLHSGCTTTPGVLHETIHALGFQHTQTRPDRDEYIKVHYANINPNLERTNYDKIRADQTIDYGIPYEYNSLMHYDAYAGAIDEDKPAISALDDDYSMTLGGEQMVFNDWKLINLFYKCNETCPNKIKCNNEGYQNPRNCSVCVCAKFHSGDFCDDELNPMTLTPGFTTPINYGWSFNKSVYWENRRFKVHPVEAYERSPLRVIRSPEGTRIRVTIDNIFDHHPFEISNCDLKALEIVDGDLTRVGKRFCMRDRKGHSFVSTTNVIGWLMYSSPGLGFVSNITLSVEP